MFLVETGDRRQVASCRYEAVGAVQLPLVARQLLLVQILQFSPEVAEERTLRVRVILLWTLNTFLNQSDT